MTGQLSQLQAWMESVGITWNRELIQLVDSSSGCSGLALGVQAARDVAEGESLCIIPKAACISIRNSSISDIIQTEELGGGLGLVLAVLHELSLGKESEWYGYLQALPAREYLPVFWRQEELQLLDGTEAEGRAVQDRELTQEDFETHVLPLPGRHPGRLRKDYITLDNFRVAASYVASRAFGIDEYHGDAMVPLADIFNHKASVVELAPGYEVHGAEGEGESSSEDEDDSEGEGEGEDDGEIEGGGEEGANDGEEEGGEERGEGAACGEGPCGQAHHQHHHQHGHLPAAERNEAAATGAVSGPGAIVGAGGVGGRGHGIQGITTANGLHLRLEIGILDKDDHLEIVAASAVPKGAEVHNTYGEHGNAELLAKYGFALRDNPFTAVALDKAAVVAAAKKAVGARVAAARRRFLEAETDVLDPEEEPFEVLPNGHISPALFVALRVLGAEGREAEQWGGIADALSLPLLPPQAAAAAAAGGDGEESGEESGEDPSNGSIPAVQIWGVREPVSRPGDVSPTQEPASEGGQQPQQQPSASAAKGAQCCQEGRETRQVAGADAEQPSSRSARLAALLTRHACAILRQAVQQRLARYGTSLEADRKLWEQQQQQQQQGASQQAEGQQVGGQGALSECAAAVSAALLLRLSEKEVLHEMLEALAQRERALAAQQAQQGSGEVAAERVEAGRPKRGRAQQVERVQQGGKAKRGASQEAQQQGSRGAQPTGKRKGRSS